MLWLKAIIYRVVRILIVFISGYFILDDATTAVSIAGIDMVAATLFYYYFDKCWSTIELYIRKQYRRWKYRKFN
jgi:uncharacterized membrane protein